MPNKNRSALDYAQFAQFPGTLVIYMGVTTARRWTQELIEAGMPADRPVALIRRCSWPNQQTIRCRLDEVADLVTPYAKFPPPAIAIIGDVAQGIEGWDWFERRPLFGETVIITRPIEQAAELRERLTELGAETLIQPAIEILDPLDGWHSADAILHHLQPFDDLIFSSSNGVRRFMRRLLDLGLDTRVLAGKRIAAIGPGTTDALASFFLVADVQPPTDYRAESLVAALSPTAKNRRVLLIRASRGRDTLARGLADAGAQVTQVVAYESQDVKQLEPDVAESIERSRPFWITATSSAIARAAVHLLQDRLGPHARWVSISPLTSDALRDAGVEPSEEADEATLEGMVQAIVRGAKKGEST
jgi:uroporphyrinogen III methyltransferase/synthase